MNLNPLYLYNILLKYSFFITGKQNGFSDPINIPGSGPHPGGSGNAHREPDFKRRGVLERAEMVVFPSQFYFHFFDGGSQCCSCQRHHINMLPQR